MTDLRSAAIALYDRYTHEGMDRRAFMAELTRIAGSTAAASALLAGIAADPAAAAVIPADDCRISGRRPCASPGQPHARTLLPLAVLRRRSGRGRRDRQGARHPCARRESRHGRLRQL